MISGRPALLALALAGCSQRPGPPPAGSSPAAPVASGSASAPGAREAWVILRRGAAGERALVLETPRLPAISADGARVLVPARRATLGGLPDLRLVVLRAADESVVASTPILDAGEIVAAEGDGRDPGRARRALEALAAAVEARIARANEAIAKEAWTPLPACSVDAPDSAVPRCSMAAQSISCGAALRAVLRDGALEITAGGRTVTLPRPGWVSPPVRDSTLGAIPVRACFGGAWLAPDRNLLVGELEQACQGGGDACIVQPAWHVVALPPAPSGAPPASAGEAPGAACPGGMTPIPAATFTMGSADGLPNERPPHPAEVAAFCLDTTEVTAADYHACVKARRCSAAGKGSFCNEGSPGQDRHPINCVSWSQARDYCAWAGKRLPTEAEWEHAARGPEGRRYPSGDDEPGASVCWRRRWNDGTCPAGTSPGDRSPFGVLDMAGNVSEWTASPSTLDYTDTRPLALHVQRGGDWSSSAPRDLRGTRRREGSPAARGDTIGFRCAKAR